MRLLTTLSFIRDSQHEMRAQSSMLAVWQVVWLKKKAAGQLASFPRLRLRLTDQPILHGVIGQFRVVAHFHFGQDARAVGADGLDAERQDVGDLRRGLA